VTARRSYLATLGLLLLGAVAILVSAGRVWGRAQVAGSTGSTAAGGLDVTGADVSGAVPALGLLALAGVLAVVATRGVVRRAVGGFLCLVGLTVTGLAVVTDVDAALDHAARVAAGVSSAQATHESTSAWPWVCAIGGLLVAIAGLLTALRSAGWPSLGGRYERAGAPDGRPLDTWAALDQGIDPTIDPDRMPEQTAPDARSGEGQT
jgi:uncharacterized membrane protein (TIGR02234 family)